MLDQFLNTKEEGRKEGKEGGRKDGDRRMRWEKKKERNRHQEKDLKTEQ